MIEGIDMSFPSCLRHSVVAEENHHCHADMVPDATEQPS